MIVLLDVMPASFPRPRLFAPSLQMDSNSESTATWHAEAALRGTMTGLLALCCTAARVGHSVEVVE